MFYFSIVLCFLKQINILYHFHNLFEHEVLSDSETKIYADKTKTWGYTFVIHSRGQRSALSPWKGVWCAGATAELQLLIFHFISTFYQKLFYITEPLGTQLEFRDIPLEKCLQIWCRISKIPCMWVKPNLHGSLKFFKAARRDRNLNTLKKIGLG